MMKTKELNEKLKNAFPEILNMYNEEVSWQEGDDTGSHIVYADVFVPYIKLQIQNDNYSMVKKCLGCF